MEKVKVNVTLPSDVKTAAKVDGLNLSGILNAELRKMKDIGEKPVEPAFVRASLTIDSDLAEWAKANGINMSKVLSDAVEKLF